MKKINIRLSKVDLVYKILREVHVLAKLNHANIVSYKTAWTEAYFGDISSNESSNSQRSHSWEEIDDVEESAGHDEETNGGVVFERQSAEITEVSGRY